MSQVDVVHAIEARLAELEDELRRLGALTQERDTLRETLRVLSLGLGARTLSTSARDSNAQPAPPKKRRYEVSPAILRLLADEPGLTSPQVADKLEGIVVTARRDPRRAVVARISELLEKRQLRRTHDGRLYVVADEPSDGRDRK